MTTMTSRFDSKCSACSRAIRAGELIDWARGTGARHAACAGVTEAPPVSPLVLTLQGGVFSIGPTTPAHAPVIKAAGGWRWHGGDCRPGCKACGAGVPTRSHWFTLDAGAAAKLREHADPVALAAIQAHEGAVDLSRATDAVVDAPLPSGLSLLPYQRAGVAYAATRRGTILGDEMGLGKTVQAIATINAAPDTRRVLIVCPASLRLNWTRELCRWLATPAAIHIVDSTTKVPASLLTGAGAHRIAQGPEVPAVPGIVVANYDRLHTLRDSLMAADWDLLIADEAHYLKAGGGARGSRRATVVLGVDGRKGAERTPGLVDRAARVLLLTGTPLPNKPIELWPLLRAVAPDTFNSFFGFAKRYCAAYQGAYGWDMSGASHLDELQDRMRAACMVRRLKADVLTELPAKRRELVVLPTNGSAAVVAREGRAVESSERAVDLARVRVTLAQASGDQAAYTAAVAELQRAAGVAFTEVSAARHETALAKAPHVAEHVAALLEGGVEAVVVMAHHKDVVSLLCSELESFGVVSITGDTAMADRDAAVQSFQREGGPRVFVGSITAAGVGLTLTRASTVVFAELDWVPGNVQQAEDRCHRIGQRNSVTVQHIVLDGSLDQRMAEVLIAKMDVADRALDREAAAFSGKLEAPKPATFRTSEELASEVVVESLPGRWALRLPPALPVATDAQRAACADAMQALAGVCDGAKERDGAGFAACDVFAGHSLARTSAVRSLTDGECFVAATLANKYRGQLGADLVAACKGVE